MDFYIKYSDSEMLRLPVVPADFTIQSGNLTQNVTVSNLGEISLWGPEKLRGVALESFFPYEYHSSFCCYKNFPKPWDCITKLKTWKNSGKPVRLLILDKKKGVDLNIEVLIETLDYSMRDASGDVYYTIAFREYKRVTIEQVKTVVSTPPAKREQPVTAPPAKRYYTVVKGDTLWGIAKRYYGNGSKYPTIFNANRDRIKDPNKISIGWSLYIP